MDNPTCNRKAIAQYTMDGKYIAKYNSIVEAERITGIGKNNISRALRGIFRHSGGYLWRYCN